MSNVRVRFAPSPTGYLHLGGLRTALYNYLFARNRGGAFVLRIEDTDRARTMEGAVEQLIETLRWCGVEYDEGPGKGGAYGPYVQSERLEIYRTYAGQLIESGDAYYCFCSEERLEQVRRQMQSQKLPPMYDRHCRSLPPDETKRKLEQGAPRVVRLKVPLHEEIVFHDAIRGAVKVLARVLDDQVLVKSDGYPTYHLANVVDDHCMQITHVIRGEEWLPSTPKHVLLYNALGWEPPAFAHLPLLLNPDKSKLSKRQNDVAVEEYRKNGYLPDALVNFVALLGWNPTGERELYSREELIALFDLAHVNKSGAVFDVQKLKWMNAQYIRDSDESAIAEKLTAILAGGGIRTDAAYAKQVVHAMKERVETMNGFLEFSDYFFRPPQTFEEQYARKHWNAGTAEQMRAAAERLNALKPFDRENAERCIRDLAGETGVKPAALIHPIRLMLTGKSIGPGVFDVIAILGKTETLDRMRRYLDREKIAQQ